MRLFQRRTVPVPTWRAWLLFGVCIGGAAFGLAREVHPFLAASIPVSASVLVVEGWLPDYALEASINEFRAGGYKFLFTTGGPISRGSHLSEHGSYAEVAAAELRSLGLALNEVTAIPTAERYRNRTFAAAVALRKHCLERGIDLSAVNVVSLGTHARRTRLCFRRALGEGTRVGIISIKSRNYDPSRWWCYSEGVKSIIEECLALPYAWFSLDHGL